MADYTISMGVVVERRESTHPWQDYTWRPIAVIPDAESSEIGKALQFGEGWTHFFAGTLPLEFFKTETEGYKTNLSQPQPVVYVILRHHDGEDEEEEDGELDVSPFQLTACPFEAMSYAESGDEIVEGVIMPDRILSDLADFVERHHVETPFLKRKNKRHKQQDKAPRAGGGISRGKVRGWH